MLSLEFLLLLGITIFTAFLTLYDYTGGVTNLMRGHNYNFQSAWPIGLAVEVPLLLWLAS